MKKLFILLLLCPFLLLSQNGQKDIISLIKENSNDTSLTLSNTSIDSLLVTNSIDSIKLDLFTMFYNVENLFDTINNLNTNDESFLPNSKKKWDTHKYNHKLQQLAKVFSNIKKDVNNDKLPDIIGLCEIENKLVINDLLKDSVFNNHNYIIIHKESPDYRGIDCALLFNNKFKLLKHDFIEVNLTNNQRPTRDIVYAQLQFHDMIINVFVNHWPSRWGGQKETNNKRVQAALVLKNYIKKNTSNDEYSIIMGDFNDYPHNESLKEVLIQDNFVNLMETDEVLGLGSYNYKGLWNWLDQIIISTNFLNNNSEFNLIYGGSFQKDFMLYTNKQGETYPSRSFGGDNWYGGFSDHLPIYSRIVFKLN